MISIGWIVMSNIEAVILRQRKQSLHRLEQMIHISVLKLMPSGMSPHRIKRLSIPAWEICTSRAHVRLSFALVLYLPTTASRSTTYIENGIACKHGFTNDVSDMIRSVPRQVKNATRQRA